MGLKILKLESEILLKIFENYKSKGVKLQNWMKLNPNVI